MPVLPATPKNIEYAARLIREGQVVAFPTETVYGLGANALNPTAIDKIYALKGRPTSNPLIVHVGNVEAARALTTAWPAAAERLASAFWPGPLTLVLPKAMNVPANVTGGGTTVAVRIPDNAISLELLGKAGVPLAAPSANISNQLSPTQASHVSRAFSDIPVLDGGPCTVGIESTVVSLLGPIPRILRPGNVTSLQLQAVVGPVESGPRSPNLEAGQPELSPGLSLRHYAPRARVFLFSTMIDAHFHAVLLGQGRKLGVIAFAPTPLQALQKVLPDDPIGYAAHLFEALHQLDNAGCELILVESVPEVTAWDGVRDRLQRATAV